MEDFVKYYLTYPFFALRRILRSEEKYFSGRRRRKNRDVLRCFKKNIIVLNEYAFPVMPGIIDQFEF